MLLLLLLLPLIICSVVFIIILSNFYKLFTLHLRHFCGYVQDIRVDEYFRKATIIGELQSHEKQKNPNLRIPLAFEKSMAIVTDVLLQNGYDPRQYNLRGLVLLKRLELGLIPTPKGGDVNGKG